MQLIHLIRESLLRSERIVLSQTLRCLSPVHLGAASHERRFSHAVNPGAPHLRRRSGDS